MQVHVSSVYIDLFQYTRGAISFFFSFSLFCEKGYTSLILNFFTQMQIKFVILTICASLATIGFAAPLVNIDLASEINVNIHRIIGG